MRILVVTSCTGEKRVTAEDALTIDHFALEPSLFAERERQLVEYLTPAEDLYSGLQHVRLMQGVSAARDHGEEVGVELDLRILSAGYGLITGDRPIAPYEATFQGMRKKELRRWADHLNVPQDIRRVLAEPYDLGLLLLGESYLDATALDETVQLGGPTIVFCSATSARRLPKLHRLFPVVLTNAHTKSFSCGLVGLKGEVAARLLRRVSDGTTDIDQIVEMNGSLLEYLGDPCQSEPTASSPRSWANPAVDNVIDLTDIWRNKPHRNRLKYFIPEWDDLVDPEYDFEQDRHSGGTSDWSNEAYAHQLYSEPNYDGILISKVVAENKRKKKERINALGVHRYLRVPDDFPIMGDCGAFGYIDQELPPYTTEEILDYYTRLGFNLGISLDHLREVIADHVGEGVDIVLIIFVVAHDGSPGMVRGGHHRPPPLMD